MAKSSSFSVLAHLVSSPENDQKWLYHQMAVNPEGPWRWKSNTLVIWWRETNSSGSTGCLIPFTQIRCLSPSVDAVYHLPHLLSGLSMSSSEASSLCLFLGLCRYIILVALISHCSLWASYLQMGDPHLGFRDVQLQHMLCPNSPWNNFDLAVNFIRLPGRLKKNRREP